MERRQTASVCVTVLVGFCLDRMSAKEFMKCPWLFNCHTAAGETHNQPLCWRPSPRGCGRPRWSSEMFAVVRADLPGFASPWQHNDAQKEGKRLFRLFGESCATDRFVSVVALNNWKGASFTPPPPHQDKLESNFSNRLIQPLCSQGRYRKSFLPGAIRIYIYIYIEVICPGQICGN